MKYDIDNRARARKVQGVPYIVPKLRELWSTNGENWAEISPTLSKFCVLLRCQALHTANGTQTNFTKRQNGADSSRIRWRRIVNVNETIDIGSLVSRGPKYFKLAIASRRTASSGNTPLIATFSSCFIRYNLESPQTDRLLSFWSRNLANCGFVFLHFRIVSNTAVCVRRHYTVFLDTNVGP